MIQKTIYAFFTVLICLSIVSCKSKTREELILQQIQEVNNKLTSNKYIINISQFVGRNGLTTDIKGQTSFIKIDENDIQLQIPDIESPSTKISSISTTLTEYAYEKKDKGVSLISATLETQDHMKYELSILITQFGDATIYMKEGFYKSISFTGELE